MPLVDYLAFAVRHRRFLAFGFLLTFASSAGQTFFIGLFGPEIREGFGLDHTGWGSLYLIGTLASALVLPWTGQLIDRLDLRWYVVFALVGLALACLALSLAQSLIVLTVAIFLLRQMGQGVTSHAAATSMARHFGPDRGKALALASMGMALGEALLPVLAILAIAAFGWRMTYGAASAAILLILLPLALLLLRSHTARPHHLRSSAMSGTRDDQSRARDIDRRQMLSEPRFYLVLPAFVAPSLIMTALFFHHLTLAESKGWSAAWITGQYWIFALSSVLSSLAAGPLIDRLSAKSIMPVILIPMILGLVLLTPADTPIWVLPYLALLGLTAGLAFTGFAALWAELYGTKHLGAIRSLASAIGVFASALGPVIAGVLLDAGTSMEMISLGFAGYGCMATVMLLQALRMPGVSRAAEPAKHSG
jgi:MFS family permease